MSLFFKTYPGLDEFEVPDITYDSTISDVRLQLKEQILGEETKQNKIIKLICNGKILLDGGTVEELKLNEDHLIVVVLKKDRSKKKKIARPAAAAQAEASESNEGADNNERASNRSNRLADLINTPQGVQLLRQLTGNPALFRAVLTELERTQPEIAQEIRADPGVLDSNPERFVAPLFNILLTHIQGPSRGGRSRPRPNALASVLRRGRQQHRQVQVQRDQLSSEDQSHIQQLCELGFPERQALDAYFASDKDVEMAANLLFQMAGRS